MEGPAARRPAEQVVPRHHQRPRLSRRPGERGPSTKCEIGTDGIKAMLYGAGVQNEEMMKNAPQVGVATVWWEGNPCK